MFVNKKPLVALLLFLAISPADVASRILHSGDALGSKPCELLDGTLIEQLDKDRNPLHILCPACNRVQSVVNGVLTIVPNTVLKLVSISVCSIGLQPVIFIPLLPFVICTAAVEILVIISKKADFGFCPLLLLCPLPKHKTTEETYLSEEDDYENRIASIIENSDTANLSPEMEYLYKEAINQLPIEMTGETNLHIVRNFIAAIQYHIAHRDEYSAAL